MNLIALTVCYQIHSVLEIGVRVRNQCYHFDSIDRFKKFAQGF